MRCGTLGYRGTPFQKHWPRQQTRQPTKPHLLRRAQLVIVRRVAPEQVRHHFRPPLDLPPVDLLHFGGGRAGPGEELVDEQRGELVLADQLHGALEVLLALGREAADDVGRYGNAGDFFREGVDDPAEVADGVLAPHLVQRAVRSRLDGHVHEGVDARVEQDLPYFLNKTFKN